MDRTRWNESESGRAGRRRADGPMVVHRHSSWEHTLLGDTPPDKLSDATVKVEVPARRHLIDELRARTVSMGTSPDSDPRRRFQDVRWIQLAGSGLWVTYGELNALADYLPDQSAADTMGRDQLIPVLQRMRAETWVATYKDAGLRSVELEGMASHWLEYLTSDGGQVAALDEATAALGTNRYQGLLARNACHFAPFSWDRWERGGFPSRRGGAGSGRSANPGW